MYGRWQNLEIEGVRTEKQWRWLSFLCIITIPIYCVHGYTVRLLLLHVVTIFHFCFDHCSFGDYCDHFVCFSVQIYLVDACWSTGMLGGTGIGQLEGVASLQDDSFLLQMSIMVSWVTLYFFSWEWLWLEGSQLSNEHWTHLRYSSFGWCS